MIYVDMMRNVHIESHALLDLRYTCLQIRTGIHLPIFFNAYRTCVTIIVGRCLRLILLLVLLMIVTIVVLVVIAIIVTTVITINIVTKHMRLVGICLHSSVLRGSLTLTIASTVAYFGLSLDVSLLGLCSRCRRGWLGCRSWLWFRVIFLVTFERSLATD